MIRLVVENVCHASVGELTVEVNWENGKILTVCPEKKSDLRLGLSNRVANYHKTYYHYEPLTPLLSNQYRLPRTYL